VEELYTITNRIKNNVADETVELLASAKGSKDSKIFKNAKKEIESQYKQLQEDSASISVS